MSSTINRLLRISLFGAVFLSGCALTNAHIDLAFLPEPEKKSPLGTISPMQVALQIEDQRPAGERQWVGNKRNGFGMVTAWVKSNKEVTSVVYDALKNEFLINGHKVVEAKETPSDLLIHIGLKRYWSDISIHFWDVEVIGTLNADVTIRDRRKDLAFLSRPMQSAFRESRQIVTDGAYESVLNGALAEFVRTFSRDPGLLKALQAALRETGNSKADNPP